MKKTTILASMILLSACSLGQSVASLWQEKEVFTQGLASYSISFIDNEPRLVGSETFTEKNNKTNQILTAYKGQSVLYAKTYIKESYAGESLRINKAGELGNASAPIRFKKNDVRQIMGISSVDGEEFYLVPSDMESYVFLIRDNGTFYKKMGKILNDRLVVMNTDYIPYPDDLHFEPIVNTAADQTRPIDGYEIRFEGVKKGRMQFTYMSFGASGTDGRFETIEYVARSGMINIKGNKISVVNVNEDKLDYTILD